jgi:hypothetical protein
MRERPNRHAWKACVALRHRGFESHSLRAFLATLTQGGQCPQFEPPAGSLCQIEATRCLPCYCLSSSASVVAKSLADGHRFGLVVAQHRRPAITHLDRHNQNSSRTTKAVQAIIGRLFQARDANARGEFNTWGWERNRQGRQGRVGQA